MLPPSELLSPKGRLNAAALWPGKDVDEVSEIVGEYLSEGDGKAAVIADTDDRDEAARQWAYYRAWQQKYDDLSSLPSNVSSSEEGSAAYSQEQIDSWKVRADAALVEFEALLNVGVDVGFGAIRSLR